MTDAVAREMVVKIVHLDARIEQALHIQPIVIKGDIKNQDLVAGTGFLDLFQQGIVALDPADASGHFRVNPPPLHKCAKSVRIAVENVYVFGHFESGLIIKDASISYRR